VSISAISNSGYLDYSAQMQGKAQQARAEFQQLGQDLSSGNISAAQNDFSQLQQLRSANSSSSAQQNNPVGQDFQQLAKDLQSGNTTAAQQDYAKIQQDFQSQAGQAHGHHHHHGGGGSSEVAQAFQDLGQALQSGNVSTAQQAYSSLEQEFQIFAQNSGTLLTDTMTAGGIAGLSVTA